MSASLERQHWAFKLAPYLTGKAQQVYAAMNSEEAADYTELKEAILYRYNVTVDSYRQQFRATFKKPGESYQELVMRLGQLARKWLEDYTTVEAIQDQLILEQLLNTLPKDMCIFVKERKPKSSLEASMLVDDYLQARKGIATGPQPTFKKGPVRCYTCGKPGHVKKDCRQDLDKSPSAAKDTEKTKRDLKDMKCFNYQQKGHLATSCPHGAMFCSERRADYKGNSAVRQATVARTQGLCVPGKVEGTPVKSVVLDTGCSRTLVRSNLVPQVKIMEGEVVAIRYAHGDTVLYPLALVHLEIKGHQIDVEAALSDTLPIPVLLGTDVPQLQDFIEQALFRDNQPIGTEDVFAVTTRAQFLKQTQQDAILDQADKLSGAVPMALDAGDLEISNVESSGDTPDTQTQATTDQIDEQTPSSTELQGTWMSELDDSMFEASKIQAKLTRKQKRKDCQRHKETPTESSLLTDISMEKLKAFQKADPTLEKIWQGRTNTPDGQFYEKDGLLYRRWVPPQTAWF